MKTILFPIAYSLQSKVAYRYAQKLAQYFGASITLLHVYKGPAPIFKDDMESIIEFDTVKYQELQDEKWELELQKLKDFAREMESKQFLEIPLDFIVTDGVVINELKEVIEANNFELIVMGMRRHSLVEKLFGNITYDIINELKCPILMIPPTAHYLGVNKIIYGTAFQVGEEKAIEKLFDWCEVFDSKLEILHVHHIDNKQMAEAQMKILMDNYTAEADAGIMTFQLLEGKIQQALEKYIQLSGAKMLAIHKRKKGFWQRIQEGELTHVLAENSEIPILILK